MEMMDVGEVKKCFKINERLADSLSIVYNDSNSMILFWNKYQIFLYEALNFEDASKVFVPEFQLQQILISNHYLVCLDCNQNIHLITLKFKNPAQKRFVTSFPPKEQGILNCHLFNPDTVLSVKTEFDAYFLCLHRINAEFQLDKKVVFQFDNDDTPQAQHTKCPILCQQSITKLDFNFVKELFPTEDVFKEHSIVVISFDNITVYGCLFSPRMTDEAVILKKVYMSPSEISDVKIIEAEYIIIGLMSGSVVRLSLKSANETKNVVHLNTALSKFLILKEELIYTDGVTMWTAENTFSEHNIKFRQLFVKQTKDFIKFRDLLICTTFSNLIYTFPIADNSVYLESEIKDEYCPAEKVLNNSEYIYKIMEEIEKNNEVVKKINVEENYITALSLSNRQDIMDSVICSKAIVYEDYQDVMQENTEVTLTEQLHKYFKPKTLLFLIKLTANLTQHELNDVLTSLLGDIKIHITLSSELKVLKTTSLRLSEPLKKIALLIPLNRKKMLDTTQVNINIKVVSNVPGALDARQTLWIVLYRKLVKMNSEHFIKTNTVSNRNVCLIQSEEATEDLILKTANTHHGLLFQITDTSKFKTDSYEWTLYVKLFKNYIDTLKTEEYYKEYFNKRKANYLLKQFTSEEFLQSKSYLCLEIGNEIVKLEIVSDDYSSPLLKVSSTNIKVTFDIRNFFSNLIYNDFKNYGPGKEFVNYSLYTITENLQKAVKDCLSNGLQEEFLPLAEQFQLSVIGALPI